MTAPLDRSDPSEFRALGHELIDLLADHLEHVAAAPDDAPVGPKRSPVEQRARWQESDTGDDTDIRELWRRVLADAHWLHHRRSVGHQVPPPLPVTALTELLATFLNNSAAIYEMGPVATAVEERVVRWMGERLGFGTGHGGLLTSGGSLGNLTALLAMRQVQLGRDGGRDPWVDGARDGERPAVLVGGQTHYCVQRAIQVLGWGSGGAVQVPVDARHRLDAAALPTALERARRDGWRVLGVVASACSTSTGAIDPLQDVATFCAEHGLWFHVDGAHGASFVLSDRERGKLAGIERADSVVWDAHKTLLCPALVTGVLFRDRRHADASFAPRAEYLFADDDDENASLDLGRRTLECTKPAMGLRVLAVLATLGEDGLARYLERTVDVVAAFATAIDAHPDFELLHAPDANIVCFRHRPAWGPAPGPELDAWQERFRRRVVDGGRHYITRTRLGGSTWLRCTVLHPETTVDDLVELLGTDLDR